MSNLADSAKAAANGQAVGFLPGGGVARRRRRAPRRRARSSRASRRAATGRASGSGSSATSSRSRAASSSSSSSSSPSPARRSPSKLLGHGPNEPFLVSGGLDADQLPAGPWTHVEKLTEDGARRRAAVRPRLGLDARARRVPAAALRRAGVARGRRRRDAPLAPPRVDPRGDRGVPPRDRRHDHLALDRADDGVPVPAVRDHARRDARDAAQQGHVRLPRRGRR